MTQADFTIANQTFPNTRTELNTSIQALATNSAGNSAPSTTFPSQWWFDSDGNQLYIRNKDNDAWVKVFTIGATSDKIENLGIDSLTLGGATPTLTMGDGGAEDALILFDGNAQNFHIGLDDSGDKLTIGLGNTLGTTAGFTMDENTNVVFPDNSVTIISSGNGNNLTLTSTDADANAGPNLLLKRDSGSPAPNDSIGRIIFSGENDASEEINYMVMETLIADETDGTEDGYFFWKFMKAGTLTERFRIETGTFVFNDPGANIDFRIESEGSTAAFFVDASANAVMTGKSGASVLDVGFETRVSGANNGIIGVASNASATISYFNRISADGVLLGLYQAASEEGNISVSGATVSFNGFTGSHWSRLADNSKPTILRGTIMESLDTMMDWYQAVAEVAETTDKNGQVIPAHTVKESIALGDRSVGDAITFTSNTTSGDGKEHTGTIVKEDDVKHVYSKISDTADSKRVYGLFHCWENDGDSVNDMEVAQVGTYIIRVHKDVTVSAGDLLVSNGDGTAKLQDDDIIRSKTIAKVNSNVKIETYADESYTVPCTLHC